MLQVNRFAECHAPSSVLWEIHSTKHSLLEIVHTKRVSHDMMLFAWWLALQLLSMT